MQIDKQQIVAKLKEAGDHDKAGQAETELPDQVDTDSHAGLLDKIGIDPASLIGGGEGGGLGSKLGL